MFGLFKSKAQKLEKRYEKHLEKARDMQRSGDLKTYARMMEEAEKMEEELEQLRKEAQ